MSTLTQKSDESEELVMNFNPSQRLDRQEKQPSPVANDSMSGTTTPEKTPVATPESANSTAALFAAPSPPEEVRPVVAAAVESNQERSTSRRKAPPAKRARLSLNQQGKCLDLLKGFVDGLKITEKPTLEQALPEVGDKMVMTPAVVREILRQRLLAKYVKEYTATQIMFNSQNTEADFEPPNIQVDSTAATLIGVLFETIIKNIKTRLERRNFKDIDSADLKNEILQDILTETVNLYM